MKLKKIDCEYYIVSGTTKIEGDWCIDLYGNVGKYVSLKDSEIEDFEFDKIIASTKKLDGCKLMDWQQIEEIFGTDFWFVDDLKPYVDEHSELSYHVIKTSILAGYKMAKLDNQKKLFTYEDMVNCYKDAVNNIGCVMDRLHKKLQPAEDYVNTRFADKIKSEWDIEIELEPVQDVQFSIGESVRMIGEPKFEPVVNSAGFINIISIK